MGHRDGIPEDTQAFIRWARNILIYSKKNAKRWGIPPLGSMMNEFLYREAKAEWEETGPEPPPEPDPINGFTVYWDQKKRFMELLCAFHGIEFDRKGRFDQEELARCMLACQGEEHFRQWQEFLLNIVRENSVRYNMPPEWVENVRRRMEQMPLKPKKGDEMQQILFMFYHRPG